MKYFDDKIPVKHTGNRESKRYLAHRRFTFIENLLGKHGSPTLEKGGEWIASDDLLSGRHGVKSDKKSRTRMKQCVTMMTLAYRLVLAENGSMQHAPAFFQHVSYCFFSTG